MHLSELFISNFRLFGSEASKEHLQLSLKPGLNILAGENDSGKSAIIDAIRLVLWTTSQEYHRITEDDFHVSKGVRATELTIQCVFRGIQVPEAARYLEWLTTDEDKPRLCLTLQATLLPPASGGRRRVQPVEVTLRTGKDGQSRPMDGDAKELLRTTYLRPLRDAENELSAGRGSRLSQVLHAHPDFAAQQKSDFDQKKLGVQPKTLVGIMNQAEHLIQTNPVIDDTKNTLNSKYLREFSLGSSVLEGEIGVAKQSELRHILEKLELWINPGTAVGMRTHRGLGISNVLFMATELLLLGGNDALCLPLLLIEEPEAHLHPQLQMRLMKFLEAKAGDSERSVQILVTTHSPNLTSAADPERVILACKGNAYSLDRESTLLDSSDYSFLKRFLDVTKANLFFAKGVLIVEGDAEALLIPTLADLLGKSFAQNGVSVVNVGSRGLSRFSKIFQRKSGEVVPIPVACLADRDIVPDEADEYVKAEKDRLESGFSTAKAKDDHIASLKKADGGAVATFVSPKWTLEYDLACSGLVDYVHVAIQLAKKVKGKTEGLSAKDRLAVILKALRELRKWQDEGLSKEVIAARIYRPLFMKSASKAEAAQFLAEALAKNPPFEIQNLIPDYLSQAINHVTKQA